MTIGVSTENPRGLQFNGGGAYYGQFYVTDVLSSAQGTNALWNSQDTTRSSAQALSNLAATWTSVEATMHTNQEIANIVANGYTQGGTRGGTNASVDNGSGTATRLTNMTYLDPKTQANLFSQFTPAQLQAQGLITGL